MFDFVSEPKSPEEARLREINEALAKLSSQIDSFQTTVVKPVTTKLEDLDAKVKFERDNFTKTKAEEEKKFQEFIQKLIDEHNENTQNLKQDQAKARNELYELQDQLSVLKNELAKLSKEQKAMQQAIAAEQHLNALEKKLDVYLEHIYAAEPRNSEGELLKLMDFQYEDLIKILSCYMSGLSGVLNANDMGLGKTAESIVADHCITQLFYEEYGRFPRVLWVTKASLIKNTCREFKMWNKSRAIMPVMGSWNKEQREFVLSMGIEQNAVIITNYEALNSTPGLMDVEWDIVYCDEVHKLKGGHKQNPTQVWQNVKKVVKDAKFFMPMSGSPIQNEPGEMWSYLHIFDPIRFPNSNRFKREYCYQWGEEAGSVNFEQLIKVMGKQVLRHSKKDVLHDLPDKVREFRLLEMGKEQRAIYDQMKNNFFIYLDNNNDKIVAASVTIAYINRLRQLALYPASVILKDPNGVDAPVPVDCKESCVIDETMELIESFISLGERCVVFTAQFVSPLYRLEELINEQFANKTFNVMDDEGVAQYPVKCAIIDGSATSKANTDAYVQAYNRGEIQILLINMTVGGEGLNLQKGSHAIFLDRWWNPMSNEQAEDRLHRKGQKNAVEIHIMDVEDSAYQFVQAKIEMKSQMIEEIMEDPSLRKTGAELKEYLKDLL